MKTRQQQAAPGDRIASRLLTAASIILLLTSMAFAVYSAYIFEQRLAPEIDAKSLAVARSLQGDIERAVGYGIPLDALQGMDQLLDDVLAGNPELARIEVGTTGGAILYQRQHPDADTDIRTLHHAIADGSATINVGVRADYARNQLLGIFADAAIVLLVTLLLAMELLPLLVNRLLGIPLESLAGVMRAAIGGDYSRRVAIGAGGALGQLIDLCNRRLDDLRNRASDGQRAGVPYRATAVTDIRAPMFVFVLAEELSRAFLPLYVQELYAPIPGLSEQAAIALPITAFMLFVALGTLFAGSHVRRVGSARLFRWGVGLAAVGFFGLALADSLYDLLLWRTLVAAGYALGTLACQAYVTEMSTAENRTQAMSIFVGAVMVAAVCGSSLGGALADLVGYRHVFWGSLLLVLSSWLLFPHHAGNGVADSAAADEGVAGISGYRLLLADRGFMTVMLGAAIPAKLILTGSLFLIVPLYLARIGSDAATIGRVVMLYYLLMAFGNPVSAYLARRFGLGLSLVTGGGAIAGLGSLAFLFLDGMPALLLAVIALGVGQTLATAPTFALALGAGHRSVAVLGQPGVLAAMRVIERTGSVIGPLLAGTLLAAFGFQATLAIIGGIVAVAAATLPLALRRGPAATVP